MDRDTLSAPENPSNSAQSAGNFTTETGPQHIIVERAPTHSDPLPSPTNEIAQAIEHAALMMRFRHLGETTFINAKAPLKDYAGKALPCNFKLETDNPHEAAKLALKLNLGIVFIGALTSATENFGSDKRQPEGLRGVIAIKPKGISDNAELRSTDPKEYIENKSNQLLINRDKLGTDMHTVTIGAGLTYDQVNKIIAKELGPEYWVAVDITSIEEALVGAVYATGGQGPSGIKLSEIAIKINMTNGKEIKSLKTKEEIKEHEGLGGHEGGHTKLELKVLKRPVNRFGFRIILKNTTGHQDYSKNAAAILAKLAPYFNLKFDNGILSSAAGSDSVDGIEIMDKASIELVNKTRQDSLTDQILKEMTRANSEYCVYVTGNSTKTFHQLCEDANDNILSTLGELEKIAEVIPVAGETAGSKDIAENLESMRILREAIPELAKRQVTHSQTKPFSTSLDINFSIDKNHQLNPTQLQSIYHEILRAFFDYEEHVMTYIGGIAKTKHSNIKMYRYGHLGRDPHTRFTIWSNEKAPGEIVRQDEVQDVGAAISVFKRRLLTTLKELQDKHPEIQIHAGEKGKTPDPSVLSAEVLARSQAIIREAGRNWNFRARAFLRSDNPPTNRPHSN